jgi:hypothetical protein
MRYFGERQVNRRWTMSDSKVTGRLAAHWVPVVDARGRTRMEMQWVDLSARPIQHVTHAA